MSLGPAYSNFDDSPNVVVWLKWSKDACPDLSVVATKAGNVDQVFSKFWIHSAFWSFHNHHCIPFAWLRCLSLVFTGSYAEVDASPVCLWWPSTSTRCLAKGRQCQGYAVRWLSLICFSMRYCNMGANWLVYLPSSTFSIELLSKLPQFPRAFLVPQAQPPFSNPSLI